MNKVSRAYETFQSVCLHNQTNYKFPSDGLKVSHSSPTSKYMPILKYVVQNWNQFIKKMSSSCYV